jgi:Nucleotidyltransferase domain
LLAHETHVARVVVFGSFLSDKADPNDIDMFVIMDDAFDLNALHGELRLIVRPCRGSNVLRRQRFLGAAYVVLPE